MAVTVLADPPWMATPASNWVTVPFLTVTPVRFVSRIPGPSPTGPPAMVNPFRSRVMLSAPMTKSPDHSWPARPLQ